MNTSYSKVRAMTRVATDDNEDFLLSIAKHGSASHIEQLVRKFERVVKNQQATRQDLQQQRELIHYQNDDGMWVTCKAASRRRWCVN